MHPSVRDVLQFFRFDHLPPHLQEVSRPFARLAVQIAQRGGGAECMVALRHLLQAKDAAVRTVVADDAQDSVDRLIASINGIWKPPSPGLVLVALAKASGNIHLYWADPSTYEPRSSALITSGTRADLIARGVQVFLEEAAGQHVDEEG